MPGLVGLMAEGRAERARIAGCMRDMLAHQESDVREPLYSDDLLSAGRVRLPYITGFAQPGKCGDVFAWLDGEILRWDGDPVSPVRDATGIARQFARQRNWRFLRDLYGTFAGVVFDRESGTVHLFTDRFGLRFLYVNLRSDRTALAWSSETKAFLELPWFRRGIDESSLAQFLAIGYLLGERTLFSDAALVPPASVLSWRVGASPTIERYWDWSEIPARTPVAVDEGAEELGDLLVGALSAACDPPGRVGVTLSGGLDSRAILAQARRSIGPGVPAVTFGEPGSDDVTFARRAARIADARHSVVSIGTENWLAPRLGGVWVTDGQLDLMHMHGVEAQDALRAEMDVTINGFAGDIVLGGGFIDPHRSDEGADPAHIARLLHVPLDQLEGIDRFAGLRHSDYYMIENRNRRFTGAGLHLAQSVVEQRRPFFDPRLVDFAYGLPDDLRRRSRLYKAALLRLFPEYFRDIPWQKTGVTIRRSERVENLSILAHKVRHRIGARMPALRRSRAWTIGDYPTYLRHPRTQAFLRDTLLGADHRLATLIGEARVRDAVTGHERGDNRAVDLCRMLTIELWLRQIDDHRWRPSDRAIPAAARDRFR